MVKVRVPATVANIGPGFDTFGCALALYNTISIEETQAGLVFSGCDEAYQNEDNLTVVAYRKVMSAIGLAMPGLKIDIEADIPVCRGLGSSAAMIAAGAVAANAAHGSPYSPLELLCICNDIEGHPDNLAPALLGGLVTSYVDQDIPIAVRYELHPDIRFTALIPDFELSTHLARGVLPKEVPFIDAIFNISRAAVLLKALELGDETIIKSALQDRLHQPYRSKLISGFEEVRDMAFSCGCTAFCISGAGPTLLALSFGDKFEQEMSKQVSNLPGNWRLLPMAVDHAGAQVL